MSEVTNVFDLEKREFEKPIWMIAWDRWRNKLMGKLGRVHYCSYHKSAYNPRFTFDCHACIQRIGRKK